MTTAIGLMADPGLPAIVASRIRDSLLAELPRRVDASTEWRIDVVDEIVPLDAEGSVDLTRWAVEADTRHDWDMVLYITDLPRYEHGRPVVAEVSRQHSAAILFLPVLGVVRLDRRVVESLARLVGHLHRGSVDVGPEGRVVTRDPDHPEALNALVPLSGTASEAAESVEQIYATGPWAVPRLLTGMVQSNRPGRLPAAMTASAAAASAAGAYGVFFGSIWTLAADMGVDRLSVVTVLAVIGMTSWLIATNGLWARRSDWSTRRWAAMDNLVTVITVAVAALMIYAGLFLLLFVAAVVVVPPDYLSEALGEPAGIQHYLKLSWLAASLGLIAGAIGSSFDDDEAIRNATYSRREAERRALHQRLEELEAERAERRAPRTEA
ncbi:MAG: hypothetical protein QJR09_04855 [Micrococcus sp.]|nr:hypothetical protein [Micrococcus sp.]